MKVLVTGGNQGIGFALCRQLVLEYNCDVLLTARSEQKGMEAVTQIQKEIDDASVSAGGSTSSSTTTGSINFLLCDVSEDKSVAQAAATFKDKYGKDKSHNYLLDAIVNNAGIGIGTGQTENILNTNLYGTKRVCDHFIPLLNQEHGRIVNVGSGSGPNYVSSVRDTEEKAMLCWGGITTSDGDGPTDDINPDSIPTWKDIERHAKKNLVYRDGQNNVYGLSKSLVAVYTGVLARSYPNLVVSCVTPGFIDTQMTKGYGASKAPAEGTVSIRKCLFDTFNEAEEGRSGWYFGSDGIRSPFHFMRNPGEPVYDGINPFL